MQLSLVALLIAGLNVLFLSFFGQKLPATSTKFCPFFMGAKRHKVSGQPGHWSSFIRASPQQARSWRWCPWCDSTSLSHWSQCLEDRAKWQRTWRHKPRINKDRHLNRRVLHVFLSLFITTLFLQRFSHHRSFLCVLSPSAQSLPIIQGATEMSVQRW